MSGERIQLIVEKLLKQISAEFPDISIAELLSAVFTMAKSLIIVTLESQNDEHNRAEILRCLASVEQEVWLKTPKDKLN